MLRLEFEDEEEEEEDEDDELDDAEEDGGGIDVLFLIDLLLLFPFDLDWSDDWGGVVDLLGEPIELDR